MNNLKVITFGPRPQDFFACNAPIKGLYELGIEVEENSELDLLDALWLVVYHDKDEQEQLGAITILTPLSNVTYSKERLRIMDMDGDGYDDISIPDMLANGDRTIDCWLWDPVGGSYVYDAALSQEPII